MKKIFAFLLILVMAISLVACVGNGVYPSDGGSQGGQQQDGQQQGKVTPAPDAQNGFQIPDTGSVKRVSDLAITGMKTNKIKYAVDEEIILTLTWTGTPESSAWVGIIPANIAHGDEYLNDDHDISYIYLDGNEGSEFSFVVTLEPGEYTLRVNETDDGGAELAWCSFIVK